MPDDIAWPVKTRELQNNHMDSTFWNDFVFRDDDIIIGTWAKAGTTWVQQILSQIIFNGEEGLPFFKFGQIPFRTALFLNQEP